MTDGPGLGTFAGYSPELPSERAGCRGRPVLPFAAMTSIVDAAQYLFTSESVTEGHPDKLCDQVSDAILDAILRDDPLARVACETATTTGTVYVLGEITTTTYVEFQNVVRETVREIGYTDARYGFDYRTCGTIVSVHEQSPDIKRGVDDVPRDAQAAAATATTRAPATRA